MQLAEDHLEQRRFARAIASDQADAPARRQARAGAFQNVAARNADDEVVDDEHGTRRIADVLGLL